MDIEIDTNNLFFIDTINTSIPVGYLDFYSIILHELGHSHNLRHVIESNNIMHYGISPGQIKRDLEHDYSCDEGGNWVIDFSTDINNFINNCGVENINANPTPPCSHLSVENIDVNNDFARIYPNPFTRNINIEIKSLNTPSTIIQMYDLNGRQILRKEFQLNEGLNTIPIEIGVLSSGIYLINITNGNVSSSYKIIKYEE
jgi:hypothetical protein